MNMKISFSTLGSPSWSMHTAIEEAGRLGYDGIELRFIENSDRLWELPAFQGSGLKETCVRLASAGLAIPCVDTSCFFHYPEPQRRRKSIEMGKAYVELAAELKAPGVRVFGDRVQPGAEMPATAAWIAEGIHRLAEFAQPAGVEVWLETHGHFAPAAETMRILSAVNCANAGAIWDPGNAYSEFGEQLEAGWQVLEGAVRHVHVKDGVPVDGLPLSEPWTPTLVGGGMFPAQALITLLRANRYEGFISFEWQKRWHPHIPEPEIALPHFIHWIRKALEI